MSNQTNIKRTNKTVSVIATYEACSEFIVPDGLDLNDTTVVNSWWVKWDVLNILLVKDHKILSIEPRYSAQKNKDHNCFDMRDPTRIHIDE